MGRLFERKFATLFDRTLPPPLVQISSFHEGSFLFLLCPPSQCSISCRKWAENLTSSGGRWTEQCGDVPSAARSENVEFHVNHASISVFVVTTGCVRAIVTCIQRAINREPFKQTGSNLIQGQIRGSTTTFISKKISVVALRAPGNCGRGSRPFSLRPRG